MYVGNLGECTLRSLLVLAHLNAHVLIITILLLYITSLLLYSRRGSEISCRVNIHGRTTSAQFSL